METPPRGVVVEISDTQNHVRVDPDAVSARSSRASWRARVSADASISVALVDDAAIHRINRDYLDHDCPTDVV